jgi:hypothetical protein
MRVEHLAIDGSVVAIEAEADLTSKATAAGWAVVPALMQAHPFTIYPAGQSKVMEETLRGVHGIKILATEEYSLKKGKLRVGEVELPAATGGEYQLTVGAWEGSGGCLHTSILGANRSLLVEVFDTLHFSNRSRGLAIDSPVVAQPRPPEVIKEVPEIGLLRIRPAVSSELERVPKSRGFMADHGELFRLSGESQDLLFVSPSTVVAIKPLPRAPGARAAQTTQVLEATRRIKVEWTPRGQTASTN